MTSNVGARKACEAILDIIDDASAESAADEGGEPMPEPRSSKLGCRRQVSKLLRLAHSINERPTTEARISRTNV
jgi:hypothetical protein